MTPTTTPARPRYKLGMHPASPPPPPPEPPRAYTLAEIQLDGWSRGAIAHVHRVLDDCLERGVDVALTEHMYLIDAWENSAACWAERKRGFVTPKRRAWFAALKAEHLARRAAVTA